MRKAIIALLAIIALIGVMRIHASAPSYIVAAELSIRDQAIEHVVVFDVNGSAVLEATGQADSVRVPENARLYGLTVLHNHPPLHGGSPFFSTMDIRFAAYQNVQRSIVISPVLIIGLKMYLECTMDRGQAMYWPSDIYSDYDPASANPESYAQLDKSSDQIGEHATWTAYFAHHNIDYHCEVIAP